MKEFLPKRVRVVLYCVAILFAVASPIIGVSSPEYGVAVATASGVLTAAAGATALSNVPKKEASGGR